jgi:hypothetical protein
MCSLNEQSLAKIVEATLYLLVTSSDFYIGNYLQRSTLSLVVA